MAIDKDLLLAAIDSGRENSYGTDENSDLGRRRAQAMEAYLGLNVMPAPMGRSQVVDRSVYETISTLIPSLVRIFASSSDEICKFTPVGAEDEQGADQTTAVVAWTVTQQNQWEQIFGDWLMDAALMMNGYCMAYWDESDAMVRETYENQSEDQLAALMTDGVAVVQHSATVDEEATREAQEAYKQQLQQYQMARAQWQQMAAQAQQTGQPVPPMPQAPPPPQPVMQHTVVIERKANEGKVCLKVLPPEHTRVHVDTPDYTLKDCPFFEYKEQKTIAELREMGLDVPEDVSDSEDHDSEVDDARDRFGEGASWDDESGPGIMRKVWASMAWVVCDAGDGVSRRYYCIVVGRTILHAEAVDRIPVASMTPQPLPHRHIGLSIAEVVKDIQDIKTAVKRGGLDNLYLANNGRNVVSDRVNLADLVDSRPGGVIRLMDGALPSEGHVMPLVHPLAFDQIIGSLEYFDQERQNRSGAMRGAAGLEANAMNKAAVGTTVAMQSHSAMRTEHIARTMAPAVEYLFSVVHELISKHRNKGLALKLQGKWITVDPQAWRTKRDVRISVGVGAGNKESMMMQLQGVLAAQMQVGLPMALVGRDNIRATNVEILKLAGFSNPDKFWPDPTTLPPQQPQPSPEQIKAQASMQELQFKAQQEQQKFQAEQQTEMQRMQLQAQVDGQREEMQARQKQLELQQQAELQRQNADQQFQLEQLKLQMEQWKASLEASVKLEIANKTAQTSMDTAQISKQPDTRVDKLLETIARLEAQAAAASAPKEIIFGEDGRIKGYKQGDKVSLVERDPKTNRPMRVQ